MWFLPLIVLCASHPKLILGDASYDSCDWRGCDVTGSDLLDRSKSRFFCSGGGSEARVGRAAGGNGRNTVFHRNQGTRSDRYAVDMDVAPVCVADDFGCYELALAGFDRRRYIPLFL